MARPPTLQDVAQRAEVSTSTAARVLRGTGDTVNTDLRDRVLSAAREIGYVPNVLARSLRGGGLTQRSCILGVLPPEGDGRDAPWWSKALAARGVATSCPDGVLRFAPHWPNDAAREMGAVTDALDDARAER